MSARPPATVIALLSRVDRAAARSLRDSERRRRGTERRRPSRAQAEAHEALIARLTEAHKIVFKRVNWDELEASGQMAPTVARDAVSAAARRMLAEYRPSLVDTLLGREQARRRELTEKVVDAARADAELYARAKAAADAHNRMVALAPEVRAHNVEAVAAVLKVNGAAQALKELVEGFELRSEGHRLIAEATLIEFDALPDEVCKTTGGVPAFVELPRKERSELQLTNACSVALRVAAEVLQVAQVEMVEVVAHVCRPGGLAETDYSPVLYVRVPAEALAKANLKKADATPTIAALGARLTWTAERGLAPIELVDLGLAPRKVAA